MSGRFVYTCDRCGAESKCGDAMVQFIPEGWGRVVFDKAQGNDIIKVVVDLCSACRGVVFALLTQRVQR